MTSILRKVSSSDYITIKKQTTISTFEGKHGINTANKKNFTTMMGNYNFIDTSFNCLRSAASYDLLYSLKQGKNNCCDISNNNAIVAQPGVTLGDPPLRLLGALRQNLTVTNDINNTNIDSNFNNSTPARIVSSVYGTDLSANTNTQLNALLYDYDHSIINYTSPLTDGSYNVELPVINDIFTFPSTFNNNQDLTNQGTISRRYATFIWKMSTSLSSRQTLSFLFNGTNESFKSQTSGNSVITSTTNTLISLDFDIMVSSSNTTLSDTKTFSWANGARTGGGGTLTLLTANNNNAPNTLYFSPPISYPATGTITYSLPLIVIQNLIANGYVLLRVGLPLNSPFTFTSISASLN